MAPRRGTGLPSARQASLASIVAAVGAVCAPVGMTAQDQMGDSTETRVPLELTTASAERDWPGPLRVEPVGEAVVVPQIPDAKGEWSHRDEPDGDHLAAFPWLDIVEVGMSDSRATYVILAAIPEPADPAEHRRAYGVVVDTDRDGLADYRVGMENAPGDRYRLWRTDLRTGETSAGTGAPYVPMGDSLPDASWPGDWHPQGLSIITRPVRGTRGLYRFYAWSSEIADGRIVASDYAPDVGWLESNPRVAAVVPGESPGA